MTARPRTLGLAGAGALSLALAFSGIAAAGSHFTVATRPAVDGADPALTTDPSDPTAPVDTTATWEDTDGNGVDDDCQAVPAVADPASALAADVAADLDGNGVLSQAEAAQSGRIGGVNCNHGGYVSGVATAKHDCTTAPPAEPTAGSDSTLVAFTTAADGEQGDDAEDQGDEADDQGDSADDQGDEANDQGDDAEDQGDEAKEADDRSDCAAMTASADHAAAKDARTAAHAAAKAEREATKAAARAERDAKKAAARAERDAAKAERKASHGQSSTHGKHGKHGNHGH